MDFFFGISVDIIALNSLTKWRASEVQGCGQLSLRPIGNLRFPCMMGACCNGIVPEITMSVAERYAKVWEVSHHPFTSGEIDMLKVTSVLKPCHQYALCMEYHLLTSQEISGCLCVWPAGKTFHFGREGFTLEDGVHAASGFKHQGLKFNKFRHQHSLALNAALSYLRKHICLQLGGAIC